MRLPRYDPNADRQFCAGSATALRQVRPTGSVLTVGTGRPDSLPARAVDNKLAVAERTFEHDASTAEAFAVDQRSVNVNPDSSALFGDISSHIACAACLKSK